MVEQKPRTGTFANGMDYLTWDTGPKKLLYIQGGPGSDASPGTLWMFKRMFGPLLDAGYALWVVTRRRHMPSGHSIADMAEDYAQAITEEMGGKVDLVVGISTGGLIAQYLAAHHPECFQHMAIVSAGCEVSDWGKKVDTRLATAYAEGDMTGAGMALAEYALSGRRWRWARWLIGAVLGRFLTGWKIPPDDMLTEARAGAAFNSRTVLHRIRVPVLLISGDRDRAFPRDVVKETAKLIPDCTLVWYEGQGHLKSSSDKRMARSVLAFIEGRQRSSARLGVA